MWCKAQVREEMPMKKLLSMLLLCLFCGMLMGCGKKSLEPIRVENEAFAITLEEFEQRCNKLNDEDIDLENGEWDDYEDDEFRTFWLDRDGSYPITISVSKENDNLKGVAVGISYDNGGDLEEFPEICFPYIYAFCGDEEEANRILDELDIPGQEFNWISTDEGSYVLNTVAEEVIGINITWNS